jgi:RimJ/RimL family protein N-acetyltransferase
MLGETARVLRFVLSDHCHLRLFEEADAEEFHRVIDADRPKLTPWWPWAADESPEGTLRFIRLTRRQIVDNDSFQTPIVCDAANQVAWRGAVVVQTAQNYPANHYSARRPSAQDSGSKRCRTVGGRVVLAAPCLAPS